MTHSVEKNENNESGVYSIETDQEWQTRQVRTARQYRVMEAFHGLMMGDYMGASMLDQKLAASHMIKNREVPDSPDSVSWPAEVAIQCTYNTIDAAKDDGMCTLVSKTFRYHKGDALVCAVGAIVLGAYWADVHYRTENMCHYDDDMQLAIRATHGKLPASNHSLGTKGATHERHVSPLSCHTDDPDATIWTTHRPSSPPRANPGGPDLWHSRQPACPHA